MYKNAEEFIYTFADTIDMGKRSTYLNSWFTVIVFAIAVNAALAKGVNAQKTDTSYLKLLRSKPKQSLLKNSLHLTLPPLRPAVISNARISLPRADDKLLTNVEVYPNPVTDQVINVKYNVSRNAYVNVKIMDVLGNDVVTLFSQRVENGDQSFRYNVNNRLTRGFYFLRIIAGTESVNRRISVL